MIQLENWLAFTSIAFMAAAIPGPAILLVSTHSLQFGPLHSLFTVAGNITGLFIMSGCSVLGLSALVVYSSTTFTVIKIIGAVYLLYLGVKIWRGGIQIDRIESDTDKKLSSINLYSQGVLIALTNPKAIIFTSALFPQFIDVSKPLLPQFTVLVITLMLCSFTCLTSYSLLSQKLKKGSKQFISGTVLGRVIGSIFILAGGALVLSNQK